MTLASPLDGMLVLDLGLAAAGPFGAQLLAELGATVIKIQQLTDGYWMSNHIGMSCNRGKRSLAVDLKRAKGLAILHRLVERADVVHHNMRYDAAERLGVDYESLRRLNPRLVYCHTRGFEHGERDSLPGNDQTGAALAGTDWMDGGLDNGGRPIWPVTALGDTGNGLLSALAVVQALYHRDRTGQGQFVETSIIYAHLLNTSLAWKSADGTTVGARPSLDAMQLGWGPLYRLYPTAEDGWLCLAVASDEQFGALCEAVGRPWMSDDPRLATAEARSRHAGELAAVLEEAFGEKTAPEWFDALDSRGVPCEVTSEDSVVALFDDPELKAKGWIATYEHPTIGKVEHAGLLFDFSETPGKLWGPSPIVGQHTREILFDLGYDTAEIDALAAAGVVVDAGRPHER